MESGRRSPLVDFFRRGEIARDVRLLAARGALATGAHEQLALLVLLSGDDDQEVAATAAATLDRIPHATLGAFLAREDVAEEVRAFFLARGIRPADAPAGDPDAPLVGNGEAAAGEDADESAGQDGPLSTLPITTRVKLAVKGTREQRAVLVRDPNKLVSLAVLSSPKITDSEIEAFARMTNVSEEVLRVIGMNRSWMKNYSVASSLARNPKTPPAISMHLVHRLNDRDLKMLTTDRNVPEVVRLAARKVVSKGPGQR